MNNNEKDGFNSYFTNNGKLLNPHPRESQAYNEFESGWIQAQRRQSNSTIREKNRKLELDEKAHEELKRQEKEKKKRDYLKSKGL